MPNIYKFRGKLPGGHHTVSGESWVYGDLVHINGEPHICGHGKFCLKVIPETVGMSTGLPDKRGNEIYDGDIVKAPFCGRKLHTFTIRFTDGGFYAEPKDAEKLWKYAVGRENRNMVIIGNIHDNPELMEISHV